MKTYYSTIIECCRGWNWGMFYTKAEAIREKKSIVHHHNAMLEHHCTGSHKPVVKVIKEVFEVA